jgi:hypothetical protein
MALKDIFTMIKADRYTADGCEEIKKVQEAIKEETADAGLPDGTMRHRKDGDYIKQAGKWVPAKKGNGGAKKADKPEAGKPASAPSLSKAERQDAMAKQRFDSVKEGDQVTAYGNKVKIVKKYPGSNSIDVEFKDSKGETVVSHLGILDIDDDYFDKKGTESKPAEAKTYKNEEDRRDFRAAFTENPKDSYDFAKTVEKSIPMSQGDKEELKNLKSFMQDEGADYKQALRSRASNLVDGNKSNGDWYPEKEKSIMKIAKAVGYDKELHQFIKEEYKGYDLGYSEDAAPRQLTGDCKVRVRKG